MVLRKMTTPIKRSTLCSARCNCGPVYPEALNNLGILYLRTHRRDEAVSSFEECIRVAPAFDQALLELSPRLCHRGQRRKKARAVLLALLKQHPGHEQALKMMEQLGR